MTDATRIIQLYERHASAWIAARGTGLFCEAAWLTRVTDLIPAGSRVLDLGCGAGAPIAAHLIQRGYAITGVDTSPTLVRHCRSHFPEQAWLVQDMRTLALDDRFHAILAWDSFFHLTADDQRRMFPIFARHAGEGAALLFNTGPAHGEAIGAWQGEPLYHASLDGAEYRALLHENGFEVVDHAVADDRAGGRTVWLAVLR